MHKKTTEKKKEEKSHRTHSILQENQNKFQFLVLFYSNKRELTPISHNVTQQIKSKKEQ
jgi:hypothetical protein